jgi:hypothetical protein
VEYGERGVGYTLQMLEKHKRTTISSMVVPIGFFSARYDGNIYDWIW